MAKRAIIPTPRTFAALVAAVRAALITGQARADRAYLESYHTSGFLIDAHILFFKARADYGAKVIPQLAEALGVGDLLLYRCLRFVREFPILSHGIELSWTHYRLLLEVPDKTQRRALEAATRKNHWKVPELERRVREANAINVTPRPAANAGAAPDTHQPLVPQRGTPGLHWIVDRGDGPSVDLGFKLYWPLTAEQAKRFAKGDIVRVARDDSIRRADDATKAELFTYAATLRRVIDGDTLVVALEVSPGVFIEQTLRLRGLDCPEMSTPEGKAAKRFVDALVAKTTAIVINTTKPDKYDRYLADVFLTIDSEEIFLNTMLLANGHAVRKDADEFGD
jgi:endonuclease YncB( thermonuclease family)